METLHIKDVEALAWKEARPPVGYDVYLLLPDNVNNSIELAEKALKIGYILGKGAEK